MSADATRLPAFATRKPPRRSATREGGVPRAGVAALIIVGAALVAYLPALRCGFIWDDDSILTENKLVRAADGLRRFWLTTQPADYWPVTNSSFWIEWRMWGLHAAGYHAVNLALHAIEALLLWGVLRRLKIPGAFVAALLFAVHPVNVESVAWIAERKNLLMLLFYLLAILCFLNWEGSRPPVAKSAAGWLGLSLFFFVLALLSKGSAVTLPLVLTGLILWTRRLDAGDAALLAPYYLLSAGFAGVNVWFQQHHLHEAIRVASPIERLLGAGAAVWFYLSKAVVPFRLVFVYPPLRFLPGDFRHWAPLLAAVALTTYLLRSPWRSARYAWGFFCVALVPVMGFADVYFMKYSLVADHYQHVAIIGVLAMAGAAWNGVDRTRTLKAVPCVVVALLMLLTWRRCGIYRDSKTLYASILREDPDSWLANNNLGNMLPEEGKVPEAEILLRRALRIRPDSTESLNDLGLVLADEGRTAEAIALYQEALRIQPDLPEAHNSLGLALGGSGGLPEAIAQFQEALREQQGFAKAENNLGNAWHARGDDGRAIAAYRNAIGDDPEFALAHFNLGIALAESGRLPDAAAEYGRALKIDSGMAEAALNLGAIYAAMGRTPDAIAWYERTLAIRPDFAEAHNDLGRAFLDSGRLQEAIAQCERALQLRPAYAEADQNLGLALLKSGRAGEAVPRFEEALRIRPDYAEAHENLGVALGNSGRMREAAEQFRQALRLRPGYPEASRNLQYALRVLMK